MLNYIRPRECSPWRTFRNTGRQERLSRGSGN